MSPSNELRVTFFARAKCGNEEKIGRKSLTSNRIRVRNLHFSINRLVIDTFCTFQSSMRVSTYHKADDTKTGFGQPKMLK